MHQTQRAQDPETPTDELLRLSKQSRSLAKLVAQNPSCPALLLEKLARRSQWFERQVAKNPNCVPSLLGSLAEKYPSCVQDNPALGLLRLEEPGF
jgi:hypothetical protein